MSTSKQRQTTNKLAFEFPIVAEVKRQNFTQKLDQRMHYITQPLVLVRVMLYTKYSQSQNYYYTRDVNEILSEAITKAAIRHKDMLVYDDHDEFLKRGYLVSEYPSKIHLLSEYYKFHTDIPRIFVEPINTVLNHYYDKKRKYEYYRIAKIIEEENKKHPERPPKGIVGEKPSPVNSLEQDDTHEMQQKAQVVDTCVLKDISELNRTQQQQVKVYTKEKRISQQKLVKRSDQSSTLHDLWGNLDPQLMDGKMAEDNSVLRVPMQNQEVAKLNHFIKYIKEKQLKNDQNTAVKSLIVRQLSPNTSKRTSKPEVNAKVPQYSIEKTVKSRNGSQRSIENTGKRDKQQTQPSSKIAQVNVNVNMNVAAKQFQINLLNLKDLKLNVGPSIQSARASSAVEQDFRDNLLTSNLRKLNFLQQTNISANTSPNNTLNRVKSGSKNSQKKPETLKLNKVAQLQTVYIEEDDSKTNRQIAQTHRPKINSQTQNYFNAPKVDQQPKLQNHIEAFKNIHKLIDGQKKSNMQDLKKLSLGNLELMQFSQQGPLSNRSNSGANKSLSLQLN